MKLRHSLLYAIRHYFVFLVLSCALVGFGIHGLATFEPAAPNAAFSSPISDNAWVIYLAADFALPVRMPPVIEGA
ncbi:hypothetical protein [Xanthomonas campestris]|uniref:hypothetical protein n=1 Tax=Xanthomonas campestris TaxID=339 RepID=UPI002367732A|nr:hypothetical protein [Xanthomonas campestris]WDJ36995.1 hypothetical protein JH256_22255 [Xanthomonas campestris pv. campestris]